MLWRRKVVAGCLLRQAVGASSSMGRRAGAEVRLTAGSVLVLERCLLLLVY